MAAPLVSIIVPSFNQARYIRETIDSILAQSHRPIEILVFDGGSMDDTVAVLRSYGPLPELRWRSERDEGVVDAVNKGLAAAEGEILAIQSSDDVYLPGAIAEAVQALGRDPGLGLVYADVEYIDADSIVFGRTRLPRFDLTEYVGKRTFVPQASAFFTRRAVAVAGGWAADVSYAADADFYLRIASNSKVRKIDALWARYRYHADQRDRAGRRIADDWERAVRRWVDGANPPPATRKAARVGIHLTRAHYLSDEKWVSRTLELYKAAWLNPAIVRRDDFPRRELLPGRTPIWKFLSRCKRALGFAPRGG